MTVFTKKFINILFLHITSQKFNTRKLLYFKGKKSFISRLLKKGIYFKK